MADTKAKISQYQQHLLFLLLNPDEMYINPIEYFTLYYSPPLFHGYGQSCPWYVVRNMEGVNFNYFVLCKTNNKIIRDEKNKGE